MTVTIRSRRTAMAAATALLLAGSAACSGKAGSGGSGSSANGSDPAAGKTSYTLTADTGTPKGDLDSFTWSIFAEPPSLDYTQAFDYPPNQVLANVCESLLRWNPDLTTSPGLATDWKNPDPKTWVFDIRPGVKFHDGTTLTADDVVASLSRNMDPNVASVWANQYRNVDKIEKTGPLQVTMHLKSPDSTFLEYMAASPGTVESAATLSADGKDYGGPAKGVNCTGPFAFQSWQPGQSIVLKRFDDYWDPSLKAHSKQVKFTFIGDPTARVNAFQTGEVDGGWMVPPGSYAQLAPNVYFGKSTTVADEVVSNLSGPLGDPRVRQALLMATDRKGIINAGDGGVGEIADSLVTPDNWNNAPDAQKKAGTTGLPAYPYDKAKAKALAQQAGVHGQQVVIATSPLDTQTTIITQAIAQACTDIGLTPKIDTISADKYTALFTDPAARKGVDLFLTFWYTSVTDPLDMYSSLETGAYSNYGSYSNKDFDAAFEQAVGSYDPATRAQATQKAQQIALTDLPWLPLYFEPVSVYMGSKITGLKPSIDYLYYPWAAEIGAK
ncbi:peptide/nickel transport system substrate-binding protein [Catenulispora sp. GP43]|uniref:ABC transporter substrate-binding protein n=1 Tax=Catenulispora sp. GP43 TaxID=3156263 RepID=UPI00351290FF